MKKIKYKESFIGFRELPDRVVLNFLVTNCPNRCMGCHSPELRKDVGMLLTTDAIKKDYEEHNLFVQAICFLGHGEYNQKNQMIKLFKYVRNEMGLEIVLYSGFDKMIPEFMDYVDYYKIGHWDVKKGPLEHHNSNQKMYKMEGGKKYSDFTHVFWEKS